MSDLSNTIPKHSTVLVIGGGPSGAMSAILLAREGINVTLLEKTKFPRYHIGESLLTSLIPVLEFTDLFEKIDNYGFVKKFGGFFRVKHHSRPGHIDFRQSKTYQYSYQVIRSEFDKLLLDHAKEMGAQVFEETSVTEINFQNDIPVSANWKNIQGSAGTIHFDYLIDASGLSGLMANNYLKNRTFQDTFANIAVGAYWDNYQEYVDDDGVTHKGAFSMEALMDGSGWLWAIPLHDGTLSVGAVIHKNTFEKWRNELKDKESIYKHALSLCQDVHKLIKDSKQVSDVKVWQDYSYVAKAFGGTRYRLVGDAAGFIDPLFSSGVHLAIFGALSAAATICSSMKGEMTEAEANIFHDKCIRSAYTRFVITVAGVYQQIQNQKDFVMPKVEKENFQLAFDLIQPIVSGNLDVSRANLTEEQLQRAIQYTTDMALEAHNIKTNNPVSKLMAQELLDSPGVAIDKHNAIDGQYIRMKRGQLGIAKLNLLGSATAATKNKIIKYALRRLDKKRKSKVAAETI